MSPAPVSAYEVTVLPRSRKKAALLAGLVAPGLLNEAFLRLKHNPGFT
jgi:hypothetical protein